MCCGNGGGQDGKSGNSPGQLLTLIVLFDMGTAILRVLAMTAGKDAWLAILLGTTGGVPFFGFMLPYSVYTRSFRSPVT